MVSGKMLDKPQAAPAIANSDNAPGSGTGLNWPTKPCCWPLASEYVPTTWSLFEYLLAKY